MRNEGMSGFPSSSESVNATFKAVRLINNGDKILHGGEVLEVTNTSTRNGFQIYVNNQLEPFFTYDRDEGEDTLKVL